MDSKSVPVSNLYPSMNWFDLATDPERENTIYLPKILVGKGLYNNMDLFFEFVPYSESSKTSRYGFQFRWSPYQAQFFPLNISILTYANSANLSNKLITRTTGADLIFATMLDDLSFFFGGGWVRTFGSFVGGTNGITDSLVAERESTDSPHFTIGVAYHWEPILIGLGFDRYRDSVISFKLGLQL